MQFGIKQCLMLIISMALGSWFGIFVLPKCNGFLARAWNRIWSALVKPIERRQKRKEFVAHINRMMSENKGGDGQCVSSGSSS